MKTNVHEIFASVNSTNPAQILTISLAIYSKLLSAINMNISYHKLKSGMRELIKFCFNFLTTTRLLEFKQRLFPLF